MIFVFIMLIVLIVLIVVGMDISWSMVAASLTYFLLVFLTTGNNRFTIVTQFMADQIRTDTLVAVPLFILMGSLMTVSGITTTLVRSLLWPFRGMRGSLGYVNVAANLGMSGMSGSSVADAAATSMVLVDPMVKTGFTRERAGALTAAAATVGAIIPPSIPFVLIGGIASLSIGTLFVAGVLPGIVMAAVLMVWVAITSRRMPPVNIKEVFPSDGVGRFRQIAQIAVAIALPLIVVLSLVSGFATPTEAAAFGCIVAFASLFTVFRAPSRRTLLDSTVESAISTASILITLGASGAIGWILAIEGVGAYLAEGLQLFVGNPPLLWAVIIVGFLIIGLLLEAVPVIVITVPVVYPHLASLGLDPIHFSVVMVVTLMIGTISPPVGLNLFAVSRAAKVPLNGLLRASWPYVGVLTVAAYIVALVPEVTLWLPALLSP